MNNWEWIFRQSKVNDAVYEGELLSIQNWDWPRQTWFQARLQDLRRARIQRQSELTPRCLGIEAEIRMGAIDRAEAPAQLV